MATWTSSTQSSTFNADSYVDKAASMRKYSFNSGVNGLDGGEEINWHPIDQLFNGLKSGYDVVGINASKITSELIPAFELYIKGINGKIDQIKVTAQKMKDAFRGTELERQVTNYVNKMEQYLKNFTTQIRAFEDKLIDVKKAWDKSQQVQAQGVSKTSSAFANLNEYSRKM